MFRWHKPPPGRRRTAPPPATPPSYGQAAPPALPAGRLTPTGWQRSEAGVSTVLPPAAAPKPDTAGTCGKVATLALAVAAVPTPRLSEGGEHNRRPDRKVMTFLFTPTPAPDNIDNSSAHRMSALGWSPSATAGRPAKKNPTERHNGALPSKKKGRGGVATGEHAKPHPRAPGRICVASGRRYAVRRHTYLRRRNDA